MGKRIAAVLFGGQSSEHEVSCMSVVNVIDHIDREKYELLLIGITKEGRWLKVACADDILSGAWKESYAEAAILPDGKKRCALIREGGRAEEVGLDVVFPVLHGLYGEDGTVQGLLEMAQIPYVGCGVLSSAVCMDKLFTKIVAQNLGVCQAAYLSVMKSSLEEPGGVERSADRVEAEFAYPVFVKPANAGSSKGVTKAENREDLAQALTEAAAHDRKILVEETIVGREVECAVFGGGRTPAQASGVGEILAAADFYDFDAKYNNSQSRTVIDPDLPAGAREEIRSTAVKIFQAVDGYGLARVDFFVKDNGEVIFNEINTMPGFTAISMYPKLWEAAGMGKDELVDRLMEHALTRYDR